ncbi:MAG: voltage-gated potassium channel [Actinomycetota bacterium]|nr:voltage-gated potassium channel [Actinomycetota bacterium]
MTTGRASAPFERFSAAVDGPMMVLAIIMVPLLVAPLLWNLSGSTITGIDAADWFIWALFVMEYATKLYLTPNRPRFVRTHLLDLAVIALPLLRPLRLLRLLRVAPLVMRTVRDGKAILGRRGLQFTMLVAVVVIFASAAAEAVLERTAKASNIHGFGDGLWSALTTVTTVGYGDRFPVTAAGRGITIVLMLTGIAVFGAVTASIAAYLVESQKPDGLEEISDRLGRIEASLAALASTGAGSEH